ncbi:MAG: lytic transglycosylase domain-containing protein [Sinobacteraceae bacterium]|nr:lytic transglycosylase domain-containing protein [Nevskiaceae bacterium]
MTDALPACIEQAAHRYEVPAALIRSVLDVEGGGYGVAARNRNGSEDLGWMQINTIWLPQLVQYGIDRRTLLTDPCINISVGAWILRFYALREGEWTRAIRAYNTGSGERGQAYAYKVIVRWHAHAETGLLNATRITKSHVEIQGTPEQGRAADVPVPFAIIARQ